jgi:hypothetical protein
MVVSGDDTGSVSMLAGMRPTMANGEPLLTLTLRRIPAGDVPPVPAGALFAFAGYAYELEPGGASFDPYVTLAITLSEADFAGLQGRDLSIKWYNPATSAWEDLPTTVDPVTRTVSAKITHTSIFALFASIPPTTAPVTQAPTTLPPTPALSGILSSLWIIVVAVIIIAAVLVIFLLMKRRGQTEGGAPPAENDWKLE